MILITLLQQEILNSWGIIVRPTPNAQAVHSVVALPRNCHMRNTSTQPTKSSATGVT